MRTSPNRALFVGALSIATLATTLTGQSPARPDVDPETGALSAGSGLDSAALLRAAQDDEYSVIGMYERLHGEFLRNSIGFRPDLKLQFGMQHDADFDDEVGQFDFNEYRGEFLTRAPVDPDTHLILGGNVGLRAYRFDNVPIVGDEDLWEVSGEFGVGRFFQENLLVEATFRPGLYSDFDGTLKSDDWQFFGRVLATYQPDPDQRLYLKGGIEVSQVFEDTPIYPLLGISWQFTDAWRFDALLPLETAFRFTPSAEWIFSAGLSLDGDEYHRRSNITVGAPTSRTVRTQEVRAFFDATYRTSDELSVFGRIGSTIAGENSFEAYRPGVGGGVVRDDFDGAVNPVLFFEVGVGVNF